MLRKRLLAAVAVLALLPAFAFSQGGPQTPPENPKYRRFKGYGAASIPTPPAGFYYLYYDTGSSSFKFKDSGGTATAIGGGTPGGSNTQVQFNDSSAFGGDAGFVYNKTTDALTVAGPVSVGRLDIAIAGLATPDYSVTAAASLGLTIVGGGSGGTRVYAPSAASYWQFNGALTPGSDAALDIGDSTHQARDVYVSRSVQGAATKTLTESSATNFVRVDVASNSFCGGYIEYTIHADDASDFQARSGIIPFAIVNKAGTETVTVGTVTTATEVVAVSTGTLTNTFTGDTSPTNGVNFAANAVSSLTQTTLAIKYRVVITSGSATVTGL